LADTPPDCELYYGYLGEREKDEEIPEQCITCPKLLGCMLDSIKTSYALLEKNTKQHLKGTYTNSREVLGRHQHLPPLETLLWDKEYKR
jgi:hypothetical protein